MRDLRKILAPPLPSPLLYREQLLNSLEKALGSYEDSNTSALCELVLLCAPAGYGKTTLLADAITRLSLTCCWYFLDRSDLSIHSFLNTLLASLRRAFPAFGSDLDSLLVENIGQEEAALQKFLDALLGALAVDISEHFVLALCNYQEVNRSSDINSIVNQLLNHLPPQCLLVIESRALPNLDMASLIASRKMLGVGTRGLQFSAQDLYALTQLQSLLAYSEAEAAQLAASFDGWITGILLSSRIGATQFDLSTVASSTGRYSNRQQLVAYVINNVFRHEVATYTFLKDTSLLAQLTPALCDALLGTTNAATLLEDAEAQGLFIQGTINEIGDLVYIFHPILRELLQEELRRHESERYRSLQHKLALLLFQKYEYQVALDHALEAQEYSLAAEILLEGAPTFFQRGQSESVLLRLNQFPTSFAYKHPQLLLLWVNTYIRRGDLANARLFFQHAQELEVFSQVSDGSSDTLLLRAKFSLSQGKLLLSQGEYQLAQQLLRQALAWIPDDERVLRIGAYQQLGICLILGGDAIHKGIVQLQQALHLCHPRLDEYLAGELHHQLANAYEWTGSYTIAEHHRHYISILQDRLGQPQSIINNLTGMGLLQLRQGFVEEAEKYFLNILSLTQHSPRFLSSYAYGLLGLGELELIRRHFQQALIHLEEALALSRQLEDCYLLNGTLNILAQVYLQLGDIYTAQCLLDQTVLRTEEKHSYEGLSYALVHGTILLAQKQYERARTILEDVVRLTGGAEIHWLHVQALVRLTACFLAQAQATQAEQILQKIMALNTRGGHNYCIQVELQAYPALQPLLQPMVERKVSFETATQSTLRLTIKALGDPLVSIDNAPVTRWRMARAMELFFFLLEHPQPLRKDQIIAALWSESEDSERVNQTFRSTTYYLRQTIGDACLIQRSGQYWLDLTAAYGPFWYDVAAFEEQQRLATRALEEEEEESAARAFQKMVDLYHGDYVQAFYSDWCIRHRDELRTACMEAHQQLALIAWRREAWDESLVHWQHLLTLDPCLEKAHYGAMRCYARQGRRDLALRQYQRCSRDLHEQLHVKPGSALQKLYQRLTNDQGE